MAGSQTSKRARRILGASFIAAAACSVTWSNAASTWTRGANTQSWSTASNWSSGEPTASDTAIFNSPIPAGDTTVQCAVSPTENARALIFGDNYGLTLGNLLFSATGTGDVTVSSGKTVQITTILTSSVGLTKLGAGQLNLFQTNSITGAIDVSAGELLIQTMGALGAGTESVTLGGTLEVTTTQTTSRQMIPNGGGLRNGSGDILTLSVGLGAGSGSFTKTGPGTLILSVGSTRTGATDIDEGTVRISNGTGLGSGSTPVVISGTLELNNAAFSRPISAQSGGRLRGITFPQSTGTLTAPTSGSFHLDSGTAAGGTLTLGNAANDITGGTSNSSLLVEGSGTVILGFASDYVGHWDCISGTLRISNDNNLGNVSNNVTFGGGTLQTAAAISSARELVADSTGTFDSNSFNSTFGPVTGAGTLTKASAGTLSVTSVRAAGLNITGGTVRVLSTGGAASGTSKVTTLTLSAGTKLDLTDNKMVTKTPVGTATGTVYNNVSGLIQSGRNGGGWGGNGIVTSQSSATSGNFTSIGVATAAQVKGIAGTNTAVWGGQTVTAADTLIMYTYGGDATLDGKINVDDYTRIDFNVPLGTKGWYNGDFNYDGKINVDDYTIIDFNVGIQGAPFPTGFGSLGSVVATPEPAVGLTVFVGAAGLIRRRRHSR